jgi:hypothetical protein
MYYFFYIWFSKYCTVQQLHQSGQPKVHQIKTALIIIPIFFFMTFLEKLITTWRLLSFQFYTYSTYFLWACCVSSCKMDNFRYDGSEVMFLFSDRYRSFADIIQLQFSSVQKNLLAYALDKKSKNQWLMFNLHV